VQQIENTAFFLFFAQIPLCILPAKKADAPRAGPDLIMGSFFAGACITQNNTLSPQT
jgi:hypothetical protein